MKIEEGKFYKTRDGRKVGPMIKSIDYLEATWYSENTDVTSLSWYDDGVFLRGSVNQLDLIEEWKEEKMPKFKVGDFVTADGWSNQNGLEICAIDSESYWLNINTGPYPYSIYVWDSKLKLVTPTPKSPVVEKMVKSIEPGVYGRFNIQYNEDRNKLAIQLSNGPNDFRNSHLVSITAEELESAAKTFMELAEYLRERG